MWKTKIKEPEEIDGGEEDERRDLFIWPGRGNYWKAILNFCADACRSFCWDTNKPKSCGCTAPFVPDSVDLFVGLAKRYRFVKNPLKIACKM
ncbi:unnamed protein product [Gongylonema pulchrum]|uniref:CW domain-containing protein n=1 Tax=Gongylonema pulchrum TaxID=637853 RepID=A0A183DM82_9BILA|nr:unnamed protein product [Gongylonema pulchrum]